MLIPNKSGLLHFCYGNDPLQRGDEDGRLWLSQNHGRNGQGRQLPGPWAGPVLETGMCSTTSAHGPTAATEYRFKLLPSFFPSPQLGFLASFWHANARSVTEELKLPVGLGRSVPRRSDQPSLRGSGRHHAAVCCRRSDSSDKLRKTCPDVPRCHSNGAEPAAPRQEGERLRERDRQRLGCANGDFEDSLVHERFC